MSNKARTTEADRPTPTDDTAPQTEPTTAAQVAVTYNGDKRWDNSAGLVIGDREFVTGVPVVMSQADADAVKQQLDGNPSKAHYKVSFKVVEQGD
jgi:uncharacterized protein YgiM (DUF1202 family)